MILYKNLKLHQEIVKLINKLSKVEEYNINVQNQLHFYTLTMTYLKNKFRK